MVGIECCGNSLGLGTLLIFNLHFVCEVVLVILQVMWIPYNNNEKLYKLWIFYVHGIVCVCLASGFFGIFHDKPFFMIPQIILQLCILIVAAVNVFSWLYLSPVRFLVFTELRNYLPKQTNNIDYFDLHVRIVVGSLFVGVYFYFVMVVLGFYKKLRKESKFNASLSKSSTVTEEIIL